MIVQAQRLVGLDEPSDWSIQPTKFPSLFQDEASDFASVLADSRLTETAKRYEKADEEALEAQKRFRRCSSRATWLIFTGTALAAVVTALAFFRENEVVGIVTAILGGIGAVAGILATGILAHVQKAGMLKAWMKTRAKAETNRLEYFRKLTHLLATEHGQRPDLLLMGLELVRRYQLAVQQLYYSGARKLHLASARKSWAISTTGTVLVACGTGLSSLAAITAPDWVPLALLGTLGGALVSLSSRRGELNQDERNAERYERTAEILSKRREEHSEVQQEIADGNAELLTTYVDAIQEQLSLEHRQWLDNASEMDTAVNRLSEALKGTNSPSVP